MMFEKFDLDAVASHYTPGYATNGIPRNPKYEIPDVVLNAPNLRKIKVISIGAGISGIANAYYIQKHIQNVDHVIYEKNPDLGGTWFENRYPRCACDIPSHAYTFPFALNPDWPRFFSYAPDIWKYLNKVVDVFDLRKYMVFSVEAVGAYWQEEDAEWLVKLKRTKADGTTEDFEERCNLLLYGTGVLNNPKMPKIDGIENFKGRIIHTARWPNDYKEDEWKKDRVAIIGSGASSIQTVPGMQPHVKHMDIFIRTGVWFVPIAENYGQNHEYTKQERQAFHSNASELVGHAQYIENQVNGFWGSYYKGSEEQSELQAELKKRCAGILKDERLLEGFTPTFGVGCRRITPGDPYMHAIQEPNVAVHFTPAQRITETGVIGEDGIERSVDTIVCATGFDTTYRPRFPIVGRNGVDLRDKWSVCPESYLGLAVPDMPNFVMFIGPTWPIENGSVMGPLMQVSLYMLHWISKLQTEYVGSLTPRQDVTDAFNEHAQEWVRHTVWTDDCNSWYRNNETGRVNAVWPGSSLHYIEAIRTPRWEDYDVRLIGPGRQNMWAFLGMGFSRQNTEGNDFSPYLNVETLEPAWLKALDITLPPEEERRRRIVEDGTLSTGWSTGAKFGTVCLAGAVSVLAYTFRTMRR